MSSQPEDTKEQEMHDEPSPVLHLRNLPHSCSVPNITPYFESLGTVVETYFLYNKQQAFIQMSSSAEAAAVVKVYEEQPLFIRGRRLYIQHSQRRMISKNTTREKLVKQGSAPASPVLLVAVYNTRVPVTLANLAQVFSACGTVLKIITFMKTTVYKALVEMDSVSSAEVAIQTLNGRDIFEGCCNLQIGFSYLHKLVVKRNNPTQIDFTKPVKFSHLQQHQQQFNLDYEMMMFQYYPTTNQHNAFPMVSVPTSDNPDFDPTTMAHVPADSKDDKTEFGEQFPAVVPPRMPSAVLLVSNVPKRMTVDNIFILFGVYGDVMRVKILFNNHSMALVEFASHDEAYHAYVRLHNLVLDDCKLSITFSENSTIKVRPKDSDEFTKDFSNSVIHRYRFKNFKDSRNSKNINPVCCLLHVANIADNATIEDLREVFLEAMATHSTSPTKNNFVAFFFTVDRRMAYVCMDSIQDAVWALILVHNQKLKNRYLRVSFSHKSVEQVMSTRPQNEVETIPPVVLNGLAEPSLANQANEPNETNAPET